MKNVQTSSAKKNALVNHRAHKKTLHDTCEDQRKRCKPYKLNGMQFYTFVLLGVNGEPKEPENKGLSHYRSIEGIEKWLAIFKNDTLVAFVCGGIYLHRGDHQPYELVASYEKVTNAEIAIVSGTKIQKTFSLERYEQSAHYIVDYINTNHELLERCLQRLLTGNNVKFGNGTAELAKLYGFSSEFDEIYK